MTAADDILNKKWETFLTGYRNVIDAIKTFGASEFNQGSNSELLRELAAEVQDRYREGLPPYIPAAGPKGCLQNIHALYALDSCALPGSPFGDPLHTEGLPALLAEVYERDREGLARAREHRRAFQDWLDDINDGVVHDAVQDSHPGNREFYQKQLMVFRQGSQVLENMIKTLQECAKFRASFTHACTPDGLKKMLCTADSAFAPETYESRMEIAPLMEKRLDEIHKARAEKLDRQDVDQKAIREQLEQFDPFHTPEDARTMYMDYCVTPIHMRIKMLENIKAQYEQTVVSALKQMEQGEDRSYSR